MSDKILFKIPDGACDCHHHIIDVTNYPVDSASKVVLEDEPVEKYLEVREKLGFTRDVVVAIAAFGYDNSNTLAALEKLGKETTRAILVLNDRVTEEELHHYNELGARGVRIWNRFPDSIDYLEALAPRLAEIGWHICFFPCSADDIVKYEPMLRKLPCQIVFDHLGVIPAESGAKHPAFEVIKNLMEDGKAWVKISGIQIGDKAPGFERKIELSQRFVEIDSSRILWGSDWPHMGNRVPDGPKCEEISDIALLNKLMLQVPEEKTRNRILVDNPAKLYGFEEI